MNSFGYLLVSGLAIAVALLPWCILMGFTYPFMMTFVRESDRTRHRVQLLYLANVIGAMTGTIVTAVVLIDFRIFTQYPAIALSSTSPSRLQSLPLPGDTPVATAAGTGPLDAGSPEGTRKGFSIPLLLFASGFVAMCMEIIWTRNFTPVLRTVVYSYSSLLATYLLASWIGSYLYRRQLSRSNVIPVETLLGAVALFSLLPLIVNDPRLPFKGFITVLLSITPLCGSLGYLTPQLIDRHSKGSPSAAGWAYAVNTFGCILGPLFASYLFLPAWGVKVSLLLLSAVLMACFAVYAFRSIASKRWLVAVTVLFVAMIAVGGFFNDTFEEYYHLHSKGEMRRDYAATVTSFGTTSGR